MKTVFSFLLFLVSLHAFSKDSVKDYPFLNAKKEGIVKLKEGNSFKAIVDFQRLPAYVEITREGENKGETLYANNFSWIKIDSLVFVPVKYRPDETTSKNYSIVQVLDTGKINLYRYFSFDEVIGSNSMAKRNSFSTCLIIKKEGVKYGDTGSNTFINFKKGIEQYIKDYSQLNAKVQNKEKGYKKEDLEKIVQEYNAFFSVQQKQLQEEQERAEKEKEAAERQRLKEELRQEILKEMEEKSSTEEIKE